VPLIDKSVLEHKKNAVVFGTTSNHIFAVACVVFDLKKYCPNIVDEIVIFYDKKLRTKDKKILRSIFPIRFIKYDFPIRDISIFNQETFRYFSKMVFSKYECLQLLNEYNSVLWLDYDIVIKADISDLMTKCDSGLKMMPSPGCSVRQQLHDAVIDYDMNAEAICASTFVFQDNLLNYMDLYRFCYDKLRKYAKYLYFGEQAIFDFMIQEFKLKIEPIDYNIYSPHPLDKNKLENAKIIHSFGQPKFWNGLDDIQWNMNYKRWIDLGGTGNTMNTFRSKLFSYIQRIMKNVKFF